MSNKEKLTNVAVPSVLASRIKIYCGKRGLKIKSWVANTLEFVINKEEKEEK